MGFFDICNDDPNLTSGNYSTTQRGNNGRSYNSNYYSTLRFPYAPVETPNGIYAFYKDPRHVFYFDKDRFGEFYIYRDRIKILYVGRITRDYNNVFTVFGNDSEEYTNFFDFDKAISALKDDELGELFIYIRNGEIVFRFAAGEAPHDVQIKRFANNIVTYGYKSSCRRVPYANILDYL
ncbi:MAG: hypothetical protein IJ676_05795, partial [Clostridia bacterium]|nr:hypothetical protein [Clostridia bacterium]